jgi:hypothetical protein
VDPPRQGRLHGREATGRGCSSGGVEEKRRHDCGSGGAVGKRRRSGGGGSAEGKRRAVAA